MIKIEQLTFNYQTNYSKELKPVSITFNHKDMFFLKVDYRENTEETCNDFIEVAQGKKFGGLMIEKYKREDTFCYIISDGTKYKIGKSKDPVKRLGELKTGNPFVKLLYTSPYIPEKYMHDLFYSDQLSGEWFNLNHIDLKQIEILMSCTYQLQADILMRLTRKVIKKNKTIENTQRAITNSLNYKIPFGKFGGKRLGELISAKEIGYLKYIYEKNNKSKTSYHIKQALRSINIIVD